jgi:hypothetical protein
MDEAHVLNALLYLAFDPVRAGFWKTPEATHSSMCRPFWRSRCALNV